MRVKHAKFSVIQKLCLIGGGLLFTRCLLALNGQYTTLDMSADADISAIKPMQESKVFAAATKCLAYFKYLTAPLQLLTSTEWLRGDRLCTWKGVHFILLCVAF